MLIDTPCFRRFAGIETMEGWIPDETTILNFRHLLEEHPTAEQILEGLNQMLSKGTILDATFINAPQFHQEQAQGEDPSAVGVRVMGPSTTEIRSAAQPSFTPAGSDHP